MSKLPPKEIERILEESQNLDYFRVTHLQSKAGIYHEFIIENKVNAERYITLKRIMNLMKDLNLNPWLIRFPIDPSL